MKARYSIGIDLGTTNCALAYVALDGNAGVTGAESCIFEIDQWSGESAMKAAATLPSFLYLPPASEAEAEGGPPRWIAGHWAREQTLRTPGRVIHSAKSWLCAHASDRSARFLPWGSQELSPEEKLSPIQASALLLAYLRDCWQEKMGDHAPFDEQRVTVTVPASFDAAAQKLTLDAALAAGFPPDLRVSLLEEPQAAFYRWLERHETPNSEDTLESRLPELKARPQHVLIVDIGGGTSDFSLFELSRGKIAQEPDIKRVAVSDHILLGGDNIDLALAHRIEQLLAKAGQDGPEVGLSPSQWQFLVARCRQIKEQALALVGDDSSGDVGKAEQAGEVDESVWRVSLPGRGSALLGATLKAEIWTGDVLAVILDGFYPGCEADARPRQAEAALREWGLAYASDSAVTRHLADFLRGLPRVDALLFNGGSLKPAAVRARLLEVIAGWQGGAAPNVLDNEDGELAVARGAARYGWLEQHRRGRIQAGAAQSLYLEMRAAESGADRLLCILPKGTPREQEVRCAEAGLRVRLNQPVSFRLFTSARGEPDPVGAIVDFNKSLHRALPALQTIVPGAKRADRLVAVELSSRLNAVGLLQVEFVAADGGQRWPLDFQLRETDSAAAPDSDGAGENAARVTPSLAPGVGADVLAEAVGHLVSRLHFDSNDGRKPPDLSPARLTKELEDILGLPKQDWNAALLRTLWPALTECFADREHSFGHEESWIALAGLLLRPGFGVQLDKQRIDELWELHRDGFWYPGKAMQVNADVLWRRVAGGLSGERQAELADDAEARVRDSGKKTPAEAVRLLGALERLPAERKAALAATMINQAAERLRAGGYADPFVASSSRLLNRALFHAGPECVVSPAAVAEAFAHLEAFDWERQAAGEMITLFLRAARLTGDRSLDLEPKLQRKIVAKLAKSAVKPIRLVPLREFVPLLEADRVSLFGEALPSGLVLE